jgi:hypothetical protein
VPDSGVVSLAANNFSADATKRHVLAASTDGTHFCAGRCDKTAGADARRRYGHPSASAAVYGEACKNKMHFDCASFVQPCFRTVLGPAILPPGTIMKNVAAQIWPKPGSQTPIAQVNILPADILSLPRSHCIRS